MKKILIFLIIIIILILGVVVFLSQQQNNTSQPISTPAVGTSSPISMHEDLCTVEQLRGLVTTEGAAGSMYVQLTLTNISNTPCDVVLGNNVQASFFANNISQNYQESVDTQAFLLQPNASAYSQARIPNGPQCSEVKQQDVSFVYHDSQTTINFVTSTGGENITVQACESENEQTIIEIWPLTSQPQS